MKDIYNSVHSVFLTIWKTPQFINKGMNYLQNEIVTNCLVPGKVYKLRVLAYSSGGDCKLSSPAWEFRVGEGTPSNYTSVGNRVELAGFLPLLFFVYKCLHL